MTKKLVVVMILVGFLIGPSVSSGQNISSLQALIQQLQGQLNTLRTQVDAANKQKAEIKQTASEVTNTLKMIKQLREGATGEEVKLLQTVLAADPAIYPDGLITGFYGKLTAKAVKEFQKKHGLDQVGNVGPKTLEKLNKLLDLNPVAVQEDNSGRREHCAIVPPGHLIAPGWLKKQGGVRPIVPTCQVIPPGILKKLGIAPTSTPDTIAPVISGVSATGITHNSAHVTWATNELANSKVWYSTSSPVMATSGTPMVNSASFVLNHDLSLASLNPSTTYYFIVQSADTSGNTATSAQFSFTTLAAPDITAPVITNVSASGITSSTTHITWTTNETATSKVWYGPVSPIVFGTGTPMVSDATLVLNHDLMLTNLNASTTYYYVVESSDASANTATSSQFSLVTSQ